MLLNKTTSALTYNTFELKGGLHITNQEPIDDRILWDSIEDVTYIPDSDKPIYYKGLMVSTKQGKAYILTGDDPKIVSNWKDISTVEAKNIQLGKDLIYSGETVIAPANSSITNAFDAVVEEMVKNELTTAAALNDLKVEMSTVSETLGDLGSDISEQSTKITSLSAATVNLSAATVNIERTYAKKSDISSVYKIVSANVVSISNSGYTTDTDTFTNVDIGNVVNTVSSVTYEEKTYPAGTNFVCIKSGNTVGKWDALAGITDIEKVNSAETSNVAISYPVNTSTTKTFADTFAMLDTYPTAPTKPVVTFTPSLSGFSSLYEVGTIIGSIPNSAFVFKLKETTKGMFNSSYEGETSPVYSYIATSDSPKVVLNGLGFTGETVTFNSMSLPNETIEKKETSTSTYAVTLGDNVLTAECHYGFTEPSNVPHTKLGYETTKTGRTASEGTATWTTAPNNVTTKTLKIRGAYAMFTNIPKTGSTSEDDISYTDSDLSAQASTKSLIDKTEIRIKYPATSSLDIKKYIFALAPVYTGFVIKKYNDLAHDYNGDVTYEKIGTLGGDVGDVYKNWNVYSIDATTETSECRFKITLVN